MNKPIFPVALVLAGLGSLAGVAQAQTAVTVYGLVDAGLVRESGGASGPVTKLTSGVQNGSRLGFRGTEDLGGGLNALFVLELGVNIDTGASGQGGLAFGRQSFVGLKGNWGVATFGRQYTPHFSTMSGGDPFGIGLAGTSTNLLSTSIARANNAIKYVAPNFGGFSAEAMYAFGEVAGNNSANREYGAAVTYAKGPLKARLAYDNKNLTTAATATAAASSDDSKKTLFATSYDFGIATGYFDYAVDKGPRSSPFSAGNPYGAAVAPAPSTDSRAMLLGVGVPIGAGTVMASYVRKDDRNPANRDADQVALGYMYRLSKRTNLYSAVAHIKNKNGAAYTVGNSTESGSGNKAFNLGVRHTF